MAYTGRTKQTFGVLANADATFLAGSATVNRYIRQLHVTNTTAGALSWNFANAATCVAATANVFGKSIAANSIDQVFFSPGLKTPASGLMRAFASAATSVNLTVIYDEEEI